MIDLQYDETIDVKRLANVPGGNKREYTTLLTGVNCCIQPLDPQISTDIEGGFGKEWLLFCEDIDLREGDRVIRETNEYRVTGVERLSFMGQAHVEATIRIFKS